MAEQSILLAQASLPAAGELKSALGQAWIVTLAANAAAAVAAVEKQSFNVIVIDRDLFAVDGKDFSDFLKKIGPDTLRLLRSEDSARACASNDGFGRSIIIPKSCEPAAIKNLLERAISLNIWTTQEDVRRLVSQVQFPAVTPLLQEIQTALQSPRVTTRQISELIALDAAIHVKFLEACNAAAPGGSRPVTDLNKAVAHLGFQLTGWFVAALALIHEYDRVKPSAFSTEQLWRRSLEVARLARQIVLQQGCDAAQVESAFAAGLLHDLGTLMLAAFFHEQYEAVLMVARDQQAPVWEIEKKNFGMSHGELGACLLGTWGLPLDLLEAVALHDNPSQSANPVFAPLTAVHVAQVWEREVNPNCDSSPVPQIHTAYLDDLGVYSRLAAWRKSMSLPPPSVGQLPPPLPSRKPPSASQESYKPASALARAKWPWFAAGAGAFVLLAIFAIAPIQRVAARLKDLNAGSASTPSASEMSRTGKTIVQNLTSNAPTPAAAPAGSIASNSAPSGELAFPELKLSGIFFSADNPSAILNGQLVHLKDEVSGVHILEIGPSHVTIEYQQRRKILTL